MLYLYEHYMSISHVAVSGANCGYSKRVGWGRLVISHLVNEYPGNDTKQSDGEAPVMLKLWVMQRNPSLPSLPGVLSPGVVVPNKVLTIRQI